MTDIIWPISQIIISCISFMFIKMKFIHYHSRVIVVMKSMTLCND